MASPSIRHVHSQEEMKALLRENLAVVVSFHAAWSSPCRKIAPFYARLATTHRSLTFVKVEINEDNIRSVGQTARLIMLPTFIMIKDEKEIDRIRGADQKGLEDMIVKHVLGAEHIAGDSGSTYVVAGDESLLERLDMRKVNCLNEAREHSLKSIVETKTLNTTDAYLESDADEQLLITLPFKEEVKVRSVILYAKDPKFGPKKIKIHINQLALGFDDVENATEPAVTQVLEVPEEVVKEGKPIHLRFVRLQRVNSLHIFIESNHGNEDVTRIDAIDVYGPGYGEPVATAQINGLRDFFGIHERGLELLKLFEREGGDQNLSNAVALLREAALLCPAGHGPHLVLAENLAVALLARYNRWGDYIDLGEATTLLYELLGLCPPGHPLRSEALSNLSTALVTRYKCEGSLSDLEEAIEMKRESLNLLPVGHPGRALFVGNLASTLQTRYEREGNISDLEEAIEMQRESLDLRPVGHPGRAASLGNLAGALQIRYIYEGSISDLEEAIEMQWEVLDLCPAGHSNRATSLGYLAGSLQTRYRREGSVSDLEEAIEKYRGALNLFPVGHPDRAACLGSLAAALQTRYGREGSVSDLDEAIEKHRGALNLLPVGYPCRAASLSNLANALQRRYEREGSVSDLEEATEMLRESLDLCPVGDPGRSIALDSLANALHHRCEREWNVSDLEEAIEKYRGALDLYPVGHPDLATSLHNLASILQKRYDRAGSVSDLEEAIKTQGEALKLRPNGHPNRSFSLLALSRACLLMINKRDDGSTMHDYRTLVNKIFTMLREAVNHSNSPPFDRLMAALAWIDASPSLAPELVLKAYNAALDQLDIVLATSSTLARKHSQLSSEELGRCKQLGVEAAQCAVQQGDMIQAVEFLERGRNLLFTQVGRYRVELEELRKENAVLAKRFFDLSSLLDSSVVSNQPTLEGRTAFEDPTARYRRVTSDWYQALEDIRAVPRFKNFLRPPRYIALQAAAAKGPIIFVIPDAAQSHALIVLQGRDTPHYVSLPEASRDEVVKLCNDFIEAFRSNDERGANKRTKTLLRSLWDVMVGPIADALENELRCPLNSRIWWCPSSYVSSLPLHAAGYYTANSDPGQNFPAKYVSSYTPTIRALLRAQSKCSIRKGQSMLIVAQPDTPGQRRLPDTVPEAEVVKTLAETKLKMKPTLLSSKEGTRAAVLNHMADHSWIHLTCHGSQNFANPFESCFCLYDNHLTLRDIIQRGLPDAKFAFLAACHTSTGDSTLWDEGLHLAAGLQFAGFQSVVGTMWSVADIDGPVIAEAFYRALESEGVGEEGIDCRGAADALSKAVKALRDQGVPISRWIRYIHIGI